MAALTIIGSRKKGYKRGCCGGVSMEELALDYIAQTYSRLGQRRVTCYYVDVNDPEIVAYREFMNPSEGGQADLPIVVLDGEVVLRGRFGFHELLDRVEKAVSASEAGI